MIKLALIGYPLAHSLSPAMHRAAFAELGLKGSYELLETPTQKLSERVEYLKNNGFSGFNVTIPHKVDVMKYLDEIDGFARKVGAVNTVVIGEEKKLSGYNTDVYGFIQAIPADIRENLKGKKAVIIGSGGAARAVGAGIAEMGASYLDIITLPSEISSAEQIKELINNGYKDIKINCRPLSSDLSFSDISLLVNATPVGMEGKFEGISPVSEDSLNTLSQDAFIYDIVYKPQKTKLIELAGKRSLKTLGGIDMLILQGARGFSLWTGKDAPVDVMKNALQQQI